MRPSTSSGLARLRLPVLSLVPLLAACVSGPPPGPSPAEIAGRNAKVIIISPFNVVSSLPPELEDSTKLVSKEMVAYLEEHGKTVKRMAFRAGRDLWKASMQEVSSSGQDRNFENAARIYARKIGEHLDFDVVIVPSLFVQNAEAHGRTAKWDGAKQMIPLEGEAGSTQAYQGNLGRLSVRAASIFVHVVDSSGETIHTKRSGLELIQHLEFLVEKDGQYSGGEHVRQGLVNDRPPIEDVERVREGIAAVFVPFLPEEIPPQGPVTPFNAEVGTGTR
jgi:hypothetical protein